jgi:hypothetical protein
MAKYLVLHNSSVTAEELMSNSTPEQMQAGIAEWIKWKENVDKNVKIEFGMPLQLVGRVISGGITDSDSRVTGYSFVEGESKEEVIKVLQTHPHLARADASLDVLEMVSMPGVPNK